MVLHAEMKHATHNATTDMVLQAESKFDPAGDDEPDLTLVGTSSTRSKRRVKSIPTTQQEEVIRCSVASLLA